MADASPKPKIAVAGTGRMGLDVGLFFLGRGYPVRWYTRTPERLAGFSRALTRRIRSLALLSENGGPDPALASHGLVGEDAPPAFDFVIETSTEDLAVKKSVLSWFAENSPHAIRATNSSSILPSEIGPEVLGTHFFYPVELTGFVELIDSGTPARESLERVRELLAACGLKIISQDEGNGFAANTLTLPLLAEGAEAAAAGADPAKVDEACRGGWLGIGPLSLMDAVGVDVILAAVRRYSARAPDVESDYAELVSILERMAEAGKLGDKTGGGFLGAAPFSFRRDSSKPAPDQDSMALLMLNRCARYLGDNLLDTADLNLILASLYQSVPGYSEFLSSKGEGRVRAWAEAAHAGRPRNYLLPVI